MKSLILPVLTLSLLSCAAEKRKDASPTPSEAKTVMAKGVQKTAMPAPPRGAMSSAMKGPVSSTAKKTAPVSFSGDVKPLDASSFEAAGRFPSKGIRPGYSVLINVPALLSSPLMKVPLDIVRGKGLRVLSPCDKVLRLEDLDTILLVSSSTKLIMLKGSEKARYAAVQFKKSPTPLVACLVKARLLRSTGKDLYTFEKESGTVVALRGTRLLLAKGEWSAPLKTQKGPLGTGAVLDGLSAPGLGAVIRGEAPGAVRMTLVASFSKTFSFNANVRFSSVAETDKGVAKFDFLGKLPPKMQAPLSHIRFGRKGTTLGISFAGDEARSRALLDLFATLFLR